MSFSLRLSVLVTILFAFPVTYFIASYTYLAWWHNKIFLFDTLIHENGRLSLFNSMFYFDHFVALVPMITVFSLCAVGGFTLAGRTRSDIDSSRAASVATVLLIGAVSLVCLAFLMSLYTVGWQRTLDYALQRIERDGVMSKGGNWNQLQLSNIPIALGIIGLSSAFLIPARGPNSQRDAALITGAMGCICLAAVLCIGVSILNWSGWQSFLNPRWLAHGIREIATYPLTGMPIALGSLLLVEHYLSGFKTWIFEPGLLSLILIGAGLTVTAGELILLSNVDVLAHAQRPSFAPGGLSIPYLLFSHVFEHFLDFVLIGPLTAGIYALIRLLALKQAPALTSVVHG